MFRNKRLRQGRDDQSRGDPSASPDDSALLSLIRAAMAPDANEEDPGASNKNWYSPGPTMEEVSEMTENSTGRQAAIEKAKEALQRFDSCHGHHTELVEALRSRGS